MILLLYKQLASKNVTTQDFLTVFNNQDLKFIFLFVAIILMPINWLIESYKWKVLVNVVQKDFTILESLKSVLIGVFFGFITPNRMGEFGGRLAFIYKGYRIKAVNLSIVGGIAQFVVTFLVGLFFSFFLLNGTYGIVKLFIFYFLPFIFLGTLIFYFNFKRIIQFLFSFKYFSKFSKKYVFNFDLDSSFLFKILLITLFRYSIYVLQYVFIFWFFGINLNFFFLIQVITTMLLIQTIIPSFALLDIGIRGNVLLNLLSQHVDNQILVLVIVLLVWILNLVIPAIVGYLNFANLKIELKDEKVDYNIIRSS